MEKFETRIININNIIIQGDRVRRDYGNLEELANDIKTNGLINPPLVMEDEICEDCYYLIAGERRWRAMKDYLGYEEMEVRVWRKDTPYEDRLELEISENIHRKDFTMTELLRIGKIKEEMYAELAKEKEAERKSKVTLQNSAKSSESINSTQEAANYIGVSRNTYQRMKTIDQNQTLLTPQEFEDWDEGKLSTNKAYNKIKEELEKLKKEKEKLQLEISEKNKIITENKNIENDYKKQISELISKGTTIETVEVQVDKPETLQKISSLEKELKETKDKNLRMSKTIQENEKLISEALGNSTNYQLVSHCSEFTAEILEFLKKMSKYDYMAESFNEIPLATRIEYKKCIGSVNKWVNRILKTINTEENVYDVEVQEEVIYE